MSKCVQACTVACHYHYISILFDAHQTVSPPPPPLPSFRDLPQYAETFSCDVHSSRSKRLGSIVGRENYLGEQNCLASWLGGGGGA